MGKDRLRRFKADRLGKAGVRDIPVGAALRIPQVKAHAAGQAAAFRKPGEHHAVAAQKAAALGVDHPGGSGPVQKVRVDGKAHRLCRAPGRSGGEGRLARRAPERTADEPAGSKGPFFQQQPVGLRPRQGGEQAGDVALFQHVAHRQQNHPLMVRHMAAHDAHGLAVRARRRKIGGLEHAQRPFHAQRHKAQQVLKRGLEIRLHRQKGGVGRDHVAALVRVQRQARQAECLIEIVQVGVEGIVPAFAYAKHAAAATARLRLDGGTAYAVQQRQGYRGLKQQRHEVFKHGSVIADQRLSRAAHARIETPQPPPVPHRGLTQHDGHKAQKPGFAGQQVVMSCGGRFLQRMHADAEQFRLRVKQGGEAHTLRQRIHASGQAVVACAELGQQHAHALRAGQQTGRQVAAIHRGDEGRFQRLQRACVVPVVQMPLPFGQGFEGGEGVLHAAGHFIRGQQAQPLRRRQRAQVQADVGGRGTVRHALVGLDLHVVGRKAVVRVGHGRLEEGERTLGHARDNLAHVAGGAGRTGHRLFQPGQRKGESDPQRARRQARRRSAGQQRKSCHRRARDHAQIEKQHGRLVRRAGKLGCGGPRQQAAAAEPQPVQRAGDGVGLHARLAGKHSQARKQRRQSTQPCGKRIGQLGQQKRAKQQPGAACERRIGDQQHPHRRDQAAQQVMPDFPPARGIQRTAGRPPLPGKEGQHIGQQLPVTPRPAVQAVEKALEGFGVAVIEGDVAGHGASRQLAFQQVVAKHTAGQHGALGRVQKGRGVDDALAHKRAAPVEVLRQIGGEGVIGVRAAASAQQQRQSAAHRMSGDLHARLQHAHPAHAPLQLLPLLQGMQHAAHQPKRAARRQNGVAVEGDHVAVLSLEAFQRQRGIGEGILHGPPVDEFEQRFQAAALALAAHVEVVAGGKDPFALQVKKRMAGVLAQGAHGRRRGGHDIAVAGQGAGEAVLKVAQKQKVQVRIRVGLMQHREMLDHGDGMARVHEHGGTYHQRLRGSIQPLHLHAGNHARAQAAQEHDGRGLLRGVEKHPCKQGPHGPRQPERPGGGDQRDKGRPAAQPQQGAGARSRKAGGAPRLQVPKQLAEAVIQQVIAHVTAHALPGAQGKRERPGAYGQLRPAGANGDQRYLSAVIGAALLVHTQVDAIGREGFMHGADGFQHALPRRAGNGPERGDGVADPQAAFRLVAVFRFRQAVGGQAAPGEIPVQPQRATGLLAGAHLGEQLLKEGGFVLVSLEQAHGLALASMAEQALHAHGAQAGALLAHALVRGGAEQLQKRKPQGQGQAISLLNGKGRNALPGGHGTLQPVAVEGGGAVPDQLTGKQAHPRHAGRVPGQAGRSLQRQAQGGDFLL